MFLLIGLAAGWLAGVLMKGRGFGLVGNLVLGVIGAFVGGWVLDLLNIDLRLPFANLLTAVLGAVLLLGALNIVKRA
ncbi:MAG: GlsB/YeaQ/YmgE family stress response membrane protein [Chloroflexi bacterium]|nr:GlsB/YeaQ/YmgE family stress response membrane protein [Chloroflexota bacterium]